MSISSDCYSVEESSVYSYNDLSIYQYSDVEADDIHEAVAQNGDDDASSLPQQMGLSTQSISNHQATTDDNNDTDALWDWEDNGSYVVYTHSDDEFDLYQFSDEDLIPEEPDEEWIVAALLNNRRDFDHLELLLEELEDFERLMDAIANNRILKHVTIYQSFFDAIPTPQEKLVLAETVCNLRTLEQLKVYYHSSFFVGPLQRIRPPHLKRLCLMFFPGRPDKDTLTNLTKFLKQRDIDDEEGDSTDGSHMVNLSKNGKENNSTKNTGSERNNNDTPPPNSALLESLSLRCDLMDDDFIQAIALGMEDNTTLTTLSFWGNNVKVTETGSLASAKIDFFLRLNQCGIRDLHSLLNSTPSDFLDKLVSEREHPSLVFYLLQSNPSFLSYSTL